MARYPQTSSFTFQYEGGYVNDPDDPGGCTNMGITIGTLKAWRGEDVTCEDVQMLSKMEAQLIYATNYWAPVWGNQVSVGVNTQLYDWGVNSGPHTSIKHCQRIVGVEDDGIMGPNTLKAIQAYCSEVGTGILIDELKDARQTYYESLSTFSKYGNGWTARNNACTDLAHSLAQSKPNLPPLTGDLEQRVTNLEQWAKSFS